MTTETIDKQKYRVNLICQCQDDAAFGYGPTVLEARRNAEGFFREHHGAKGQYRQIVVEQAVEHTGGSHYELFAAGMRYDFTRGLGELLLQRATLGEALTKRDHATHPYLFESNNPTRAAQLCDTLRAIADSDANWKLRNASLRALDEIRRIAKVVWGTWNGMCPTGKHGLDYEGQACDLCAI